MCDEVGVDRKPCVCDEGRRHNIEILRLTLSCGGLKASDLQPDRVDHSVLNSPISAATSASSSASTSMPGIELTSAVT